MIVQPEDDTNTSPIAASTFTFDYVFDTDDPQALIYDQFALDIVDSLTTGRSATIFAYGQTGSGKTFTVLGRDSGPQSDPNRPPTESADAGLFLRVFHDLIRFRNAHLAARSLHVTLAISALEIYIGKAYDLLQDGKPPVRMTSDGDKCVFNGLSTREVTDLAGARATFSRAATARAVAATKMNEESSRSHAVFFIDCYTGPWGAAPPRGLGGPSVDAPDADGTRPRLTRARLALADLAGSERLSKSAVTGIGADQAKKINLSLTVLGRVLRQMHAGDRHVNFRETELTRALQDTLADPAAMVRLLATVSPTAGNALESLSSLRFANDVKALDRPPAALSPADEGVEADLLAATRAHIVAAHELRAAVAEGHCLIPRTLRGTRIADTDAPARGALRGDALVEVATASKAAAAATKHDALHNRRAAVRRIHREATRAVVAELAEKVEAAVAAAAAARDAAVAAREALKEASASLPAREEDATNDAKRAKKRRLRAEASLAEAVTATASAATEEARACVAALAAAQRARVADGFLAYAPSDDARTQLALLIAAVSDGGAAAVSDAAEAAAAHHAVAAVSRALADADAGALPRRVIDALRAVHGGDADERAADLAAAANAEAEWTDDVVSTASALAALARQRIHAMDIMRHRARDEAATAVHTAVVGDAEAIAARARQMFERTHVDAETAAAADAVYDEAYLKGIYDAPGIQREILEFLTAGTAVVKHGAHGKPKEKLMWVLRGAGKDFELHWAPPEAIEAHQRALPRDARRADADLRRATKSLTLSRSKVEAIGIGQQSAVFKRRSGVAAPGEAERSFTVTSDGRSVAVVCPDVPTFEAWMIGLAAITLVEPTQPPQRALTQEELAVLRSGVYPGAKDLCEQYSVPVAVYKRVMLDIHAYRDSVVASFEVRTHRHRTHRPHHLIHSCPFLPAPQSHPSTTASRRGCGSRRERVPWTHPPASHQLAWRGLDDERGGQVPQRTGYSACDASIRSLRGVGARLRPKLQTNHSSRPCSGSRLKSSRDQSVRDI